MEPTKPVVVVAMGGSCQLTCSLSCKDGEVATVQWRGLDTRLGAVQSSAGNSVLSIHQAALSDTGTRVCVGSCGGRHNFQHSVQILVYGETLLDPCPALPFPVPPTLGAFRLFTAPAPISPLGLQALMSPV